MKRADSMENYFSVCGFDVSKVKILFVIVIYRCHLTFGHKLLSFRFGKQTNKNDKKSSSAHSDVDNRLEENELSKYPSYLSTLLHVDTGIICPLEVHTKTCYVLFQNEIIRYLLNKPLLTLQNELLL